MSFWVLVGVLSVVYVLVGRLERMPALRFRELTSPRPYLATDVGWYGIAILASAASVFVFRPLLTRLAVTPIRDQIMRLPLAVKLVVAVLVFDFVSFLVHRTMHRYQPLWNIHKVHHSTLELDGLATTRTHMIENMVRFLPGQALLFLVGTPVSIVASAVALSAIYGVSNHSNIGLDLRTLERLLVTPRLHRRHHVPSTTMNNYGTIFTLWDRLFGTLLQADMTDDERYGVPGEIDTYPQAFAAAFRQPVLDLVTRRAASRPVASGE